MMLVLALALCAGTPAPELPALDERPLFSRVEPAIAEGAAALAGGDAARALERYRAATATTPNQRAIVEYDVGQALAAQAMAAAAPPPAPAGPASPDHAAAAPKLDESMVADAQAAFGRARALAHDPRVKGEAALAGGNLAAVAGKVDDAITQFRQALRDDPTNVRAKKNLRRALEAKKQQQEQQQQNQEGDKDQKNEDQKNEDKKNEDKKNEDQENEDKKNEDKKNEDKKNEDQPQQQPSPPDDKKAQKKETARRMLDALRARERPLTPLELRGAKPVRAKEGKDW
ncbi:MAG: hypothetical protein IT383_13825 [Deltaproteobacteria bacterium]|nr:hypothetical protein [Deltaproteobacteria bacterium]